MANELVAAILSSKVSYKPSQRYVDKNLAPETMPSASIVALAKAAKRGVDSGILLPEVANKMLANLTVEGRDDDFGFNSIDLPAGKKTEDLLSTMEIPKTTAAYLPQDTKGDKTDPMYNRYLFRRASDTRKFDAKSDITGLDYNARMAVINLAQKQEVARRLKGDSFTPEDVIQLWNGVGPKSANHIRKVNEAERLISEDPSNAAIKTLWDRIMNPSEEKNPQADSTLLANMISNYSNDTDSTD